MSEQATNDSGSSHPHDQQANSTSQAGQAWSAPAWYQPTNPYTADYPAAGSWPPPGQPTYPAPSYFGPSYSGEPAIRPAQTDSHTGSRARKLRTSGKLVAAGLLALALVGGGVAIGEVRTDSVAGKGTEVINSGGIDSGNSSNGSSGNSSGSGTGLGNGFGGGSSSGGSSGGSSNGSSGSASNSAATSATATESVGIVDINTVLGYESAQAAGTGMILTSNGEILTNNHVISGATSIKVTVVSTGKTYTATVVGTDATDDVAVLALSGASGLQTAKISTSTTVAVGDAVVAVGNAGGTGGTPSAASGSVTALNQSITATDESGSGSENLTGLIETNADVIAGDSGGPLYNSAGQIIGMDTAASASNSGNSGYGTAFRSSDYGSSGYGSSGSSGSGYGSSGSSGSGYGSGGSGSSTQTALGSAQSYAIPISKAISIADQIESGTASSTVHIGATAFLGVEISASNSGTGAVIAGVISNGPAAAAGIVAGDTVTSVGGHTISSASDLSKVIAGYKPSQSVSITWTDASGASHTAKITLATGPAA